MFVPLYDYIKCGKICWAKLSWIQPNEVLVGKLSQCLMFIILEEHYYTKLEYKINNQGKLYRYS